MLEKCGRLADVEGREGSKKSRHVFKPAQKLCWLVGFQVNAKTESHRREFGMAQELCCFLVEKL
jgi:hypothetical protein